MGIVAREFEQSNLTALLSVIPPEAPSYNIVLMSIIELSNSPKRDEILAKLEEASRPDPEQQRIQQKMQAIQVATAEAELEKHQSQNALTRKQTEKTQAEIEQIRGETAAKAEELRIQKANAMTGIAKVRLGKSQDKTNRLKIESEERREKVRAKSKGNK
jgi:hypothetical protein